MYPYGDSFDSKDRNETMALTNIYIYKRNRQNNQAMRPIFVNTYFVRRFQRHPVAPSGLPLALVGPRHFFKYTNVWNHTSARPPVASRCPARPPVASLDMLAMGPDSVSRTNVGTVETKIGGKVFSPSVATRCLPCRPLPKLAIPVA